RNLISLPRRASRRAATIRLAQLHDKVIIPGGTRNRRILVPQPSGETVPTHLPTGRISMKAGSIGCIALCIAASTTIAFAANPTGPGAQPEMSAPSGPYMTIPLQGWAVNSKPFAEQLKQTRSVTTKAATDRATVYRPIVPCRLIDTRGFSAAIAIAGPLAPGSTT